MKVVSTLAVSIAALALYATAATAAPTRHSATEGSSFCGKAKSIARYLTSTLTLTTSGVAAQTPANLKLTYTTVVNNERPLLASAPKSLKSNLSRTFSFINLVKSDFAKADW